jgi:hypothetical protein
MVRQINPSLARLWLSDNSRQYGSEGKLVLESLTEPELRVLDFLEQGITDNQLPTLHKMAKANPDSTKSLLERLGPLMSKTSSFLPALDSAAVQREFSEIMRLYLLEHSDPAAAMRKRAASRVFVSSLNRSGLVITRGLAASGIGTVFSADQKPVLQPDTLELGYPKSELGNQRGRVAKRLISPTRVELHSRVTDSYAKTDVAILLGSDVIDPARYAPWMARDVPHLSIVFTERGVSISHLVLPGITPCLACIELQKLKQDANWAKTAPQLAQLDRDLADSSLILFAASMALSLSLNLIDGINIEQAPVLSELLRSSELRQLSASETNCGCRLEQ